jgi:hypothetical protein
MAKKPETPIRDVAGDLLLKEVDEEVRAEQLRSWWQRFGSWLVGAAIIIVLGTVASELWQGHHRQQGEAVTTAMLEAAALGEQGLPADAAARLKDVTAGDDLQTILNLQRAQYLLQAKKPEEANALLKELAASENSPALADYAAILTRQEGDITVDRPLYHTRREIQAVALGEAGKTDEARTLLEKMIHNPTTPASLAERARQLLRIYR